MARSFPPAQIAVIDLVRFGAAVLVVFHHFATILPLGPYWEVAAVARRAAVAPDWAGWSWAG